MEYEVKQPLKSVKHHCLCCDSAELHLDMDTVLYQGFGGWMVTKNGELFYMGDASGEWESFKKLSDIEKEAALDPDNDWQVICDTPLHGETYQRQGDKWVLVEQNEGFA